MIKFKNILDNEPYCKIKSFYDLALSKNEKNIQAFLIASYSSENKQVDSRYVNLKIIDADRWIFFSNYNSPKGHQFRDHPAVSALLFWQEINIQIRMKGEVSMIPSEESDKYFSARSKEKNALAISSNQSKKIDSYSSVISKYESAYKNLDLSTRPSNWGGYSFTPIEIEFWQGHARRLNKRELYNLNNGEWIKSILEP